MAKSFDTIEQAIQDFQDGKMVIVIDDEKRENEGDFILPADKVTPEAINFMATHAKGLICLPVAAEIADRLALSPMVEKNTDNHETAFTVSVDYIGTTTGISAYERALTVQKVVDMNTRPEELRRPGHMFPLRAVAGGVLVRAGHTEATVDLARLAGMSPAGICCEIMSADGHMARTPELLILAEKLQMTIITVADLIAYRRQHECQIKKISDVDFPTKYGHFRLIGYENNIDNKCHLAIVKGTVAGRESVLTRLHSECLTGDVLGSMRCDCGEQLAMALRRIEEKGEGVVLYLRQEGRGIGLANKLRAYALQDEGYDTVEANEHLGFAADARDYQIAAKMLQDLRIKSIALLTNNPAKKQALEKYGIKVAERVQLEAKANHYDCRYLHTKRDKMGHLLADLQDK